MTDTRIEFWPDVLRRYAIQALQLGLLATAGALAEHADEMERRVT